MGADAYRDTELALAVSHCLERVAGLFMDDGNRDAGEHASGRISNGSCNGRLLRECGSRRAEYRGADR